MQEPFLLPITAQRTSPFRRNLADFLRLHAFPSVKPMIRIFPTVEERAEAAEVSSEAEKDAS